MFQKCKELKRIGACIMTFAMAAVLFTGCSGGQTDMNTSTENGSDTKVEESGGQSADSENESQDNIAMGRYVENVIDVSEILGGTVTIPEEQKKWIMSKYNALSWEGESPEWYTNLINEAYIPSVACGADGTIGIIYDNDNESDEIHTVGLIVKPDGTQVPFEIATTEDEKWIRKIWITDTGRVFVASLGGTIYEVKEDGSSEKFLTIDGRPEQVAFLNNLMIIDGDHFDGLLLYDIEKKEYIEDEVLYDFVNENYKNRNYDTVNCCTMCFFKGEDGVLYLAGNKGLHRHVIGGSVMEQVIDGNLSCLSNPSYLLMGMMALPDNEFFALFADNKVAYFTYDPNVPTVPNNKLKIYSLEENDTMRQAITIFQSSNPEIFVEYEVGMGEDNSVTRDDALKKLNTQIMAGEGPDILVLDNMPVDSYIEKGLLLDLSDCLNSMEEENKPFENIVNAFKVDNKVYTLPLEIQLPLIIGKEKYVSNVESLKDIADMVEEIRKDYPEKDILGICSEKGIMRLFSMISESDWKSTSKEIDKKAIEEFLQQSKRIYDAQMDGISDEAINQYQMRNDTFIEYYGVKYEDTDYIRMTSWTEIIGEYEQIECGTTWWRTDLTQAFSMSKVKGFEDYTVVTMKQYDKNPFLPETLIGISSASNEIEEAEKMLKVLLGKENQTSLFKGLPVSEAGLEEGTFVVNEEYLSDDGVYGWYSSSNGDGIKLEFCDYWFDEEQKQFVRDWIKSVDTPYVPDAVLEDAVYSEGIRYIRGEQSLSEAVDAIEQKVSIYMSE
ncbi:MAG: carbohydrate ABC transporter substrate-binding protein [Lachnospiraceae bacterium]|nr:carbohydrate ABC transporter substrate-binding protein [Lachnospiraceae bacterium]